MQLKSVSLARNNLTDDSITDLVKVLNMKRVRIAKLNLSNNQVGKTSLIGLREFLENG